MIGTERCILVVDDEVKMVRALKDLLTARGFNVMCAYDGEEALDVYYENNAQIDLIIMDVMMPRANGYEALEDLRLNNALTPTILLTARSEEYDQVKGFNVGADDYITKPFSPSLLLARVESLLKRVGKPAQSDVVQGVIAMNNAKRSITCDGQNMQLTKREFDLLGFLMINPTHVFSREQLLNSVWGYDFEGDTRTVDTHIKQLRIKLGDKANYIKTIHRIGYQFEVPNEENNASK